MTPAKVEVRMGGLSVRVVPFGTPHDTQTIVDLVNAKLAEIEASGVKVNTQAFALEAAYEFACEAARVRQECQSADKGLAATLEEVLARIQTLRGEIDSSTRD